jgi:hypothetical protein
MVRIVEVATKKQGFFNRINFIRGWDLLATTPVGGYRCFKPAKMSDCHILA